MCEPNLRPTEIIIFLKELNSFMEKIKLNEKL